MLAHDFTSWKVQSKLLLNVLWHGRHYMMRQNKHDKKSSLWHAVFKPAEWWMRRISCGDSIINQISIFQSYELTRKQSYTFTRNNFPVVSDLSQCLPWCFLSLVVPVLTVLKAESSTSFCLKKYVSTTNVHISESVELTIFSRLFTIISLHLPPNLLRDVHSKETEKFQNS